MRGSVIRTLLEIKNRKDKKILTKCYSDVCRHVNVNRRGYCCVYEYYDVISYEYYDICMYVGMCIHVYVGR